MFKVSKCEGVPAAGDQEWKRAIVFVSCSEASWRHLVGQQDLDFGLIQEGSSEQSPAVPVSGILLFPLSHWPNSTPGILPFSVDWAPANHLQSQFISLAPSPALGNSYCFSSLFLTKVLNLCLGCTTSDSQGWVGVVLATES